jgi:8-oxo-dGTP diphosphatase
VVYPTDRDSPKKSRTKAVECVSGILVIDHTVLVEERRPDDDADPGRVLLPGGHVESGESLQQALRREMKEELGIRVEKATPVRVRYYTASNGERQRIHYFHVKAWKGKIVSNEAESVFWESTPKNLDDAEERKIVARLLSRSRV